MKTTASFRLSKYAKRIVSLLAFKDAHARGAFKRMLIEGQVAASVRPSVKRTRDVNNMPVTDAT